MHRWCAVVRPDGVQVPNLSCVAHSRPLPKAEFLMVRPKKQSDRPSFATADQASDRLREIATEIEVLSNKEHTSAAEYARWDALVAESDATFVSQRDLQRAELRAAVNRGDYVTEHCDDTGGPTFKRSG